MLLKYPSTIGAKDVLGNSSAVSCDVCNKWFHTQCSNAISHEEYFHLKAIKSDFQ